MKQELYILRYMQDFGVPLDIQPDVLGCFPQLVCDNIKTIVEPTIQPFFVSEKE